MKIGIISDIHGNIIALNNCLDHLYPKTDEILCCGDLIGYLPCVNEIFDLLKEYDIKTVRGNHDQMLLDRNYPSNKLIQNPILNAIEIIENKNINFLKKTPITLNLEFDNLNITITHGGLSDHLNEYVYLDQASELNLKNLKADFLLLGHTHIPFIVKNDNKFIVNPGSVGLPRNADPRSSYALINTETKDTLFYRNIYDLDKISKIINIQNINKNIINYLHMGCNLEGMILKKNYETLNHFLDSIDENKYEVNLFSREIIIKDLNSPLFLIFFIDKNFNMFIRTSPFINDFFINENEVFNFYRKLNCKNNYYIQHAGHSFFLIKKIDKQSEKDLEIIISELKKTWMELKNGIGD